MTAPAVGDHSVTIFCKYKAWASSANSTAVKLVGIQNEHIGGKREKERSVTVSAMVVLDGTPKCLNQPSS
jgi:hypothetical protein